MRLYIAAIAALALLVDTPTSALTASGRAGTAAIWPGNPSLGCCGESDAFEADTFEAQRDHYSAIVTDGKGVIPDGTRMAVPNAVANILRII